MFKLILVFFMSNTSIIESEMIVNEGLTKAECVDVMLKYNKAFNAKENNSEFICKSGELSLLK